MYFQIQYCSKLKSIRNMFMTLWVKFTLKIVLALIVALSDFSLYWHKTHTVFSSCFMIFQRNWIFVTNSDFLITISLKPNVADLTYFKQCILLDQIIWVWNIEDLQHRVLKILRFKYLILFQWLNSFNPYQHIWQILYI